MEKNESEKSEATPEKALPDKVDSHAEKKQRDHDDGLLNKQQQDALTDQQRTGKTKVTGYGKNSDGVMQEIKPHCVMPGQARTSENKNCCKNLTEVQFQSHFDERGSLMTQPNELVELLLSRRVATLEQIQGCTEGEIAALESTYQIKLPAIYKQFLRLMGHGAGPLFADCSWTQPELAHANTILHQKLQSGASFEFPKSAFVFLECSASEILFFDSKDGDDPPVYLIETMSEPPQLWSESFSDWLTKAASEAAQMSPNLA